MNTIALDRPALNAPRTGGMTGEERLVVFASSLGTVFEWAKGHLATGDGESRFCCRRSCSPSRCGGHAGTPMGLAPVAYTLWQQFLRYDPSDPLWPNRDRFVLSAGHASMLLYALLHLAGVRRVEAGRVTENPAVTLDDIKNFRQLDSVT